MPSARCESTLQGLHRRADHTQHRWASTRTASRCRRRSRLRVRRRRRPRRVWPCSPGRSWATARRHASITSTSVPTTVATSKRMSSPGRRCRRATGRRAGGCAAASSGRPRRRRPEAAVERVFTSQNACSRPLRSTRSSSPSRHRQLRSSTVAPGLVPARRRAPRPRRRAAAGRPVKPSGGGPMMSVFGSSSTFTSLNVAMRTEGTKRLDRYMSQTHASLQLELDAAPGRRRRARSPLQHRLLRAGEAGPGQLSGGTLMAIRSVARGGAMLAGWLAAVSVGVAQQPHELRELSHRSGHRVGAVLAGGARGRARIS